jgi:hypothetical protein
LFRAFVDSLHDRGALNFARGASAFTFPLAVVFAIVPFSKYRLTRNDEAHAQNQDMRG